VAVNFFDHPLLQSEVAIVPGLVWTLDVNVEAVECVQDLEKLRDPRKTVFLQAGGWRRQIGKTHARQRGNSSFNRHVRETSKPGVIFLTNVEELGQRTTSIAREYDVRLQFPSRGAVFVNLMFFQHSL
jgi:hypothetical protein